MKYFWQKRYIIDRIDLEQEDFRLVAWITKNDSNVWRLWWAERNDQGYFKPDPFSDDVEYSSMEEAKLAAQEKFLDKNAEVHTVEYSASLEF